MAEVVRKKVIWPHGPKSNFPWEKWTDGRIWKVKAKKDFNSSLCRFRQRLYTRATQYGLRVRTKVEDENTLIFQFYEIEE